MEMQLRSEEPIQRTEPAPPVLPTEVAREGQGRLSRYGALNILEVSGDFREMGRQHGVLLREQIPTGPLPYFRTYVERLMGPKLGRISPYLWPVMQKTLGARIEKAMPDFVLETLSGLADGAQRPLRELLDGATMPDALLWLTSRLMEIERPGAAVEHRVKLGLGCTSAVAWGAATRDGKLLHARNFDYHGVEPWPRTATVIFHTPESGQKYVSVAAAGVPLGGITAMNESGLSMAVHQHMFTDKTRLGGIPIGFLGDQVMREARNLDDAERILRSRSHIGCWTYIVTDAKTHQVLCFEENPDRMAAIRTRPDDTTFGYANTYLDPELGDTEVNLYGSYWRNNMRRHQRANELLQKMAGELDAGKMAGILSDTGTMPCRLSGSITMLMTVGSVVFRPEDGAFWVASGPAPTSHRPFLPFSLAKGGADPELGTLDQHVRANDPGLRAFEDYRDAYIAYTDQDSTELARAKLRSAVLRAPQESLYQSALGYLELKDGDLRSAERAFARALEIGHPDPERRAAFELWRGRALDLLGDRKGAKESYRRSLSLKADPQHRKAAEKGLRKPYEAAMRGRIHPDFNFSDVVSA